MKKKLISVIILMIMILPMFLNFYNVKAYSGELDPKNYIYLPSIIWIENGIGTGTISLYSGVDGYSISYQKIDITQEQYNTIDNKVKEVNDYIEECNTDLKTKKAEIDTLKTEWENLKNSGTATQEEITQALNNYNTAVEAYNELANTYKTNIETKEKEYLATIPEYTNSWVETTNTDDNVQIDLKNYSGTIYFILWAKITNGTDTYYDMARYSQTIQKNETVTINKSTATIKVDETIQLTATSSIDSEITWESSDEDIATVSDDGLVTGIKEGSAVITAKGSEKTAICTVTVEKKDTASKPNDNQDNGEWTDFSKAKFELKKNGTAGAVLEISGVTPNNENDYYMFINSNADKPKVTREDKNKIYMSYNKEEKKFFISGMEKYVELNQDIYVTILEVQSYDSENVVLYGKKLKRYAEPKYSDAFFATFMTKDVTQLITTFTHHEDNNRNIRVKVGKITDTEILQKIKTQNTTGFADLLAFAKTKDGIYNEKLEADKDYYSIAYNAGKYEETGKKSVIDLKGLQNEEYYFLYIEVYDDDGKYVGQEAVTLAQASVHENGKWYLFFYGDEDFEWVDFGDVKEDDDTKAPVTLPNTGTGKYIAIISVLAVAVIASYVQIKKMKEIR